MSHADDQAAPGWASWFDHACYHFEVGRCYTELTRLQTAERWHIQSYELAPTDGININRALRRLWHADTALGLGDVERASALASEALPSISVARSTQHRYRLTKLHMRLKQHSKVPAVATLDEQVRALVPSAIQS
jgi:hypothetical protein